MDGRVPCDNNKVMILSGVACYRIFSPVSCHRCHVKPLVQTLHAAPRYTIYGARPAFLFSAFAFLCLDSLSFPALLRAVYSSLAVHAASRASVSPSGTALEISLLSVLTTRFLHAVVFDLSVRHCAIALKPVVEMLVVLIGGAHPGRRHEPLVLSTSCVTGWRVQ